MAGPVEKAKAWRLCDLLLFVPGRQSIFIFLFGRSVTKDEVLEKWCDDTKVS